MAAVDNSPTWNYGIAGGPAAKTGSAPGRTPGYGTCRCTASPRTRSGSSSSPWPQICSLVPKYAFDGHTAQRGEPKRLRLRLFSAAGSLVKGGRRLRLRLTDRWPWAGLIVSAITRLQMLPAP